MLQGGTSSPGAPAEVWELERLAIWSLCGEPASGQGVSALLKPPGCPRRQLSTSHRRVASGNELQGRVRCSLATTAASVRREILGRLAQRTNACSLGVEASLDAASRPYALGRRMRCSRSQSVQRKGGVAVSFQPCLLQYRPSWVFGAQLDPNGWPAVGESAYVVRL